ncbi:MAG: phosphatidylglycerol:prolipoprotein diacylglycerol transferase [Hyphomonadaceae bacterium]|nr:MAG: phosphatidylglycerol:prolipoprotein diacylglycerol transferase [Hyphomonadaceae bacterium]
MFDIAIPFPNISPNAIEISAFQIFGQGLGPFAIRWYALAYIAGIIIAWYILAKLSKSTKLWATQSAPFNAENIDDFVFYATLGILIGGRLGYAFLYAPQMFAEPLSILRTWEGGMSFHGGIAGVFLAVIGVSLSKKVPLISLADAVALASPLGIGLVRVTNFINQELWGRASDVPWAIIFAKDKPALPRHPSQLYEAMCEGFLLFGVLWFAVYKLQSLKRPGLTAGLFISLYALARIGLENLREPDASLILGLTRGMLYSIPLLALGIGFLIYSLRSSKPK